MCMAEGADPCEIWEARDRRARKEYRCDECGRAIAQGESYRRIFMVCDGDASTWFACEHCRVAMEWLLRECNGYLCGGVIEDIYDHFDASLTETYLPRMWLGRVVVSMRRDWKALSGDGLLPVPVLPPSRPRPPLVPPPPRNVSYLDPGIGGG